MLDALTKTARLNLTSHLPTPAAGNPVTTATSNSVTGVPTGGFGYITNANGISGSRHGPLVARFQF